MKHWKMADIQGSLERLSAVIMEGGILSESQQDTRQRAYLRANGIILDEMVANLFEPELVDQEIGDSLCGLNFQVQKSIRPKEATLDFKSERLAPVRAYKRNDRCSRGPKCRLTLMNPMPSSRLYEG